MRVRSCRGVRRAMALGIGAALGAVIPTIALGQSRSTPADNNTIKALQAVALAEHYAGTVGGLTAPGLFGLPFELGALASDISLKHTPAQLVPPGARFVFPNRLKAGGSPFPHDCVYSFMEPLYTNDEDGRDTGIETDFGAIFGIPYRPVEDVWGDLSRPTGPQGPFVYHPHASVTVSVDSPFLSSAGYSHIFPVGLRDTFVVVPQFPEGRHTLQWQATTTTNDIMDVAVPSVLIAGFALAESYFARKAAAEAAQQAGRSWSLIADVANVGFELGLITVDVSDVASAFKWYQDTSRDTAINAAQQTFTVYDQSRPYVRAAQAGGEIASQEVTLQATDFGGVRFGRVRDALRGRFTPVDLCLREFVTTATTHPAALLEIGGPHEVTWVVREIDGGPYVTDPASPRYLELADNQEYDGTNIVTTFTQRVTVEDTQAPILVPPPGFARESSVPIDPHSAGFSFGKVLVSDLADPSPTVERLNVPASLEPDQRYVIGYRATDASGNGAPSPLDDPARYQQIVTIKTPGTNTRPRANATSAATITAEPVEITLTGADDDVLGGIPDPLEFKIVDRPSNGEFVAPLYPFFIEDFRARPPAGPPGSGDPRDLACPVDPTDSAQFQANLGSLAAGVQHEYVTRCHCPHWPAVAPPRDFIHAPTYIHISDEGEHFVADYYWTCSTGGGASERSRVAKFVDGAFVAENVNITGGFEGAFQIDDDGNLWTVRIEGQALSAVLIINGLDGDTLQPLPVQTHPANGHPYGRTSAPGPTLIDAASLVNSHVDTERGVIYVNDKIRIFMFDYDAPGVLLGILKDGQPFLSNACEGALGETRGGFWMDTDSQGNLYQVCGSRVHKFAAPPLVDGVRVPGEYVGWLGKCTANLADPTGVPFNFCDVAKQASRGFQCTDETCARASTTGAGPGQFNSARHLTVGPNDVLYVVDYDNLRVQRFAPDGTFAGEARSTGAGVTQDAGFVLGNMGKPRHVSVNSSEFHVLEWQDNSGDYFLHIFKTLPFYDVTASSAKVRYVSEFNYQGQDAFTYLVDDGIAASDPAAVTVNVARAFRAPENLRAECFADSAFTAASACTLNEDTALYLRLSADDPDGFLGFGGLDTLTFDIVEEPGHGTLELLSTTENAARYRYTPAANFNGSDALTFEAFDGTATSLEREAVELTIAPTPDPATIDFPEDLRAARGFRHLVTASYNDIDANTASAPTLTSLQWGNGTGTGVSSWANSGRTDPNGREISPQVDFGLGRGVLVGSQAYAAAGSYTLTARMANAPAENLPDTVATAVVQVVEATVVGVEVGAPAEPVVPDTAFPLVIEVTNHQPVGWAGLTARDTQASITVPAGLTLLTIDPRCTAGATIVCALGDLAPGATVPLAFSARIGLAAARNESVYALRVELEDDGPKLEPENLATVTVRVADRDEDGVIDVDDVFPDDPRYAVDTDGDGLPDEWELALGFDPNEADDAGFDADGDGFTALQEFRNGSYPLLGELQTARAGARLAAGGAAAADSFGIRIAGGDLNRDGYDETVIGAPLYGGNGAVFIAFGGADGANPALVRLDPQAGMTSFGGTVAVGDFDGNGYPDLAIGSASAVSIHVNNGRIFGTPDLVLSGGAANLGATLGAGDLDGDGAADLVVGADNILRVYPSGRDWLTVQPLPAPLTFTLPGATRSVAVADIDGDAIADLVAGTDGQVHGFLGAHNDWQSAAALTRSFILSGPGTTFGNSLASGADIHGADGIADLVVGAYGGGGQVLVYDSRSGYWNAPTVGGTSTVGPTQVITGTAAGPGDSFGDQLGVAVALAHLDTDAHADVVAGGNRAGLRDAGQIRIFRGSPAGLVTPAAQIVPGAADFDLLGHYLAIPGDVNGDGFADIAAAASRVVTAQNPTPSRGYVQILQHAFVAAVPAQDLDDDGVSAAFDNCPADANTDRADLDGDGSGDVCDADADGDGFSNDADNCPLFASSDTTNSDLDGRGDVCDDDDDNDGVLDGDDPFPTDGRYTTDTDGDGLPDEYETEHGLSPTTAADALLDLDGDGRSNLDEFVAGTDIAADDVGPAVSAPADVVVSSIGAYTAVPLGAATATDEKDGALTALPSDAGPFRAGRHLIEWRARDAAGNEAAAIQRVDVIPRVELLGARQYTAEGAVATVTAKLNGPAMTYPVSVPYTLGGTAANGADYFVSGTLEIAGGDFASLELAIATDTLAEGEETVVVTMGAPVNAVAGVTTEHVVHIVETNLAPRIVLKVAHAGGEPRSTLVATDGPVTMTVAIDDPNPGDVHAIDWSETHPALVPAEGLAAETFTFDPAATGPGVYAVRVRATDAGGLAASAVRLIRVVASPPAFVPGADSDGDGVDDDIEGLLDSNENGVSNYLEPTKERNVLTAATGGRRVLQARAGLSLTLGRAAFASGADAAVTLADVASFGDDGRAALNAADDAFSYPTGLYDFEVHGLAAAGDATQVVLALPAGLPASAVYRKYVSPRGWDDFTVDAANAIASAAGTLGACPAPGGSAYTPGLTAGYTCVQLTIEDGGPNDADGVANGVIRDPGGVAISSRPATVAVTALPATSRTVTAGATNVVALRFRLSSDSADVILSRLSLAASGTGNDAADVRAVKLWVDANGDGAVDGGDTQIGSGAYPSDNGTLQLVLGTPYALPFGDTQFLVTYDL